MEQFPLPFTLRPLYRIVYGAAVNYLVIGLSDSVFDNISALIKVENSLSSPLMTKQSLH